MVYGHPHNPLKEENELMDDKLRLKLVQLATEGYPKFRASDFESHLPRPSYTVHTLDALKQTYPQHVFHLIIGSDNWRIFSRWYESERILAENRILVYPRPGYPVKPHLCRKMCGQFLLRCSKSALLLFVRQWKKGKMYAISCIRRFMRS